MVDKGHKRAVWITWKYAAGDEAFEGFKDSYTKAGGTIVKELGLPFPQRRVPGAADRDRLAASPTRWPASSPAAAPPSSSRDYAAAGLKGKIPLYGSGFLTEGVLDAAGAAADGIITTLHYSDSLDTPAQQAVPPGLRQDVPPAAGRVCGAGLRRRPVAGASGAAAVKGDLDNKQALYKALETAVIDSPRGKWTMSKSHNPVQDMYLRVVENKENKVIGIAAKALADSGAGCKMG